MRLFKASNGNTNNNYYLDWVAISKGFGTPSGVEVDPFWTAEKTKVFGNITDLWTNASDQDTRIIALEAAVSSGTATDVYENITKAQQNITDLWLNASDQDSRLDVIEAAGYITPAIFNPAAANITANQLNLLNNYTWFLANASAQEAHIGNLWNAMNAAATNITENQLNILNNYTWNQANASAQEALISAINGSVAKWDNAPTSVTADSGLVLAGGVIGVDSAILTNWTGANLVYATIANLGITDANLSAINASVWSWNQAYSWGD